MNARIQLRVLRLGWNLPWAVLMGFGVSRFCIVLRHVSPSTANWIACVLALPLFCGFCIASAAHAAMHRPFFLVLPNALPRVRRATLWTLVVFAAVLVPIPVWWWSSSWFAVSGLVVAALTWPLTSNRNTRSLLLVPLPLLLAAVAPAEVQQAASTAPVVAGILGWAVAVAAFTYSFRGTDRRVRAWAPFNSAGPGFSGLWNQGATRRAIQEIQQTRAQTGRTGREVALSLPKFTGTTWSWARMIAHSAGRFGLLGRPIGMAAVFCFEAVLLAAIFAPVRHLGWQGFWQILLAYGRSSPSADGATMASQGVGAACLALGLMAIALFSTPPRVVYPLSRIRLGRVVFALHCANLGIGAAAIAAGLTLICFVGQAATGQWLPRAGIPAHLALVLTCLPFLPVIALARGVRRSGARIILAIVVGLSLVLTATTRALWYEHLITPTGILVEGALIVGAFALLYWRTTRHYRRCDLLDDIRIGNPLSSVPSA